MKYDKKKIVKELTNVGAKLERHEIAQIAAIEQVSTVTVKTYIEGKVTVLALGASILADAKDIIKSR